MEDFEKSNLCYAAVIGLVNKLTNGEKNFDLLHDADQELHGVVVLVRLSQAEDNRLPEDLHREDRLLQRRHDARVRSIDRSLINA